MNIKINYNMSKNEILACDAEVGSFYTSPDTGLIQCVSTYDGKKFISVSRGVLFTAGVGNMITPVDVEITVTSPRGLESSNDYLIKQFRD